MNLKTIAYKLLGLAIIIAGYFFARMIGVGELMLFTTVIGLAALTYHEPTRKRKGGVRHVVQ